MSALADPGTSQGASAKPAASRSLDVALSHLRGARPEDLVVAASVGLFLLVGAGCVETAKHDPVGATSTEEGVALQNATLLSYKGRCGVFGGIRNDTDKVLTAIVLTGFNSEGIAIATVRIDVFDVGNNSADTVLPGTSFGFGGRILDGGARLNDLQGRPLSTCSGIVRIELTDAIFE